LTDTQTASPVSRLSPNIGALVSKTPPNYSEREIDGRRFLEAQNGIEPDMAPRVHSHSLNTVTSNGILTGQLSQQFSRVLVKGAPRTRRSRNNRGQQSCIQSFFFLNCVVCVNRGKQLGFEVRLSFPEVIAQPGFVISASLLHRKT